MPLPSVLAASILFASNAAALEDANAQAKRFERRAPFAGASKDVALGGPRITLRLFTRYDPEAKRPGFVISGVFEAQLTREPSLRWASSRDCPALRDRMVALSELQAPRPYVGGLDDQPPALTTDGAVYRLWSSASRYGDRGVDAYEMRISSNHGTPLAEWTDETLKALGPCWRDAPPVFRPPSP